MVKVKWHICRFLLIRGNWVLLSVYFFDPILLNSPLPSSLQNIEKKWKKLIDILIVTEQSSLSIDISSFLGGGGGVCSPGAPFATWKIAIYRKINKMTCNIEYPPAFHTRLFCTQILKFLVIWSSVWSTRKSDLSYFLGRFHKEKLELITSTDEIYFFLNFNDFPPLLLLAVFIHFL